MGWQGREQHVSYLVLHAKQVYLSPQSLHPSPCTSSDTCLTTQPNPRGGGGGGFGGGRVAARGRAASIPAQSLLLTSAQFMSAATGRPSDMRNLLPAAPPRPRLDWRWGKGEGEGSAAEPARKLARDHDRVPAGGGGGRAWRSGADSAATLPGLHPIDFKGVLRG